jgi:hypothetical protein
MYLIQLLCQLLLSVQPANPVLVPATYVTLDTSEYVSYRLYVKSSDTNLTIQSLAPSCGCVLASVQRSKVTADRPAEVYVAINTKELDSLQPVTIDIHTVPKSNPPLKAFIYKYDGAGT